MANPLNKLITRVKSKGELPMFKKTLGVLLVLLLFVSLVGCGSKSEQQSEQKNDPKTQTTPKAQETNSDIVKIAYVPAGSPQPLINMNNSIFADELKKLGKKVEYQPTRSLDDVWPLMDKKVGSPDFVYIPIANFATYVTGKSRFGGSDKYTLIAGAVNRDGSVIISRPEIKSLKDLDGKKVGIANLRYVDEYQLEQVLATVGLNTTANGGTVKVGWDDIVIKVIENFGKGQYDAICMYGNDNYSIAMSKVPGSKILTSLNPNGLFGKQAPRYWLVAKRDLVNSNPELVKAVLRGHVLSTEKAITDIDKLPALGREATLQWYRNKNAVMEPILKRETLEKYKKSWNKVQPTYDPNVKYATDIFTYLDKKGLLNGKTPDDFIQLDLLKEVLKEMGKPGLAG